MLTLGPWYPQMTLRKRARILARVSCILVLAFLGLGQSQVLPTPVLPGTPLLCSLCRGVWEVGLGSEVKSPPLETPLFPPDWTSRQECAPGLWPHCPCARHRLVSTQ